MCLKEDGGSHILSFLAVGSELCFLKEGCGESGVQNIAPRLYPGSQYLYT
jgi:hypothetical protein